jgi:CheY-like chemotaxis protein
LTLKPEYGERRTLVVDDHAISGCHAVAALSRCPGRVRWAKTASEALNMALSWCPHIIFMDLNLPGTNGLDVCSQILAAWPVNSPVPKIIVLTGDESGVARDDLAVLKIDHLLVKPVSGRQLRDVAGLVDVGEINEPRNVTANVELPALFRDELRHRLPELDSSLSMLDRKKVAGILHQLIASAAMSGESRLESTLRALDAACRQDGTPVDIARGYQAFLKSAHEFISREDPR